MVVRGGEVQRSPRIFLGQREIAEQQRVPGSMYRHRTREAAELPFVHDDHPGIGRLRSEPALGILQARVDVRELPGS
jgi:hypothetical protein